MQIFKNVPLKLKTKQTVLELRNQTKLSFSKGLIVDCMELRQTKTLPIMQSRTSLLLSNNFSQAFLVLGTTAGAYCGNYKTLALLIHPPWLGADRPDQLKDTVVEL